MRWLIADWGSNKKHIFDVITASLHELGHECTLIPRNDMSRRDELINAITSSQYEALLTWQRFYPMQKEIIEAIKSSQLKTVFMDYGFIPHYESVVFDSSGENAESSWLEMWNSAASIQLKEKEQQQAEEIIRSQTSAVSVMSPPEKKILDEFYFPFIFLPLQRPNDSVIRFDSNVHDFGKLIRKVLFLCRGKYFVICKTHPLDRDIDLGIPDKIKNNYMIIRTNYGEENEKLCDYLLSRAALVISINSNMLFRSLLFGTPCIATGRGWYTGSDAISEVNGVDGLNSIQVRPVDHRQRLKYISICLQRQLHFNELNNAEKCARVFETIGVPIY